MKSFLKDTSGNIALNIALLGIPVILSGGVAIDYSQFARKQSSLQNVTDSAALAVALDLQSKSQAEIEAKVDSYFKANLSAEQYLEIKNIKVEIPSSKEKVTVTATGKHPTSLMQVAGIKNLTYEPKSVVNAPTGNAEIMMVLDTTGSMSVDGKIDALKVSASTFVEDLLEANDIRERVKIGITPFARYVNVGLDNRSAPWIDVPADYTDTQTVDVQDVISQSGCADETYQDEEGVTRTRTVCTNIEYGPTYQEERTTDYTWGGCVGSRNYPNNLSDSNYNQRVPGLLNVGCPNRITQLTTDENKLKSEISSLNASGVTYIPTGLTWGWRALSSGEPFDDGVTYQEAANKSIQKVIVLMSDGENQSSINNDTRELHNGTNLVQANQYMIEVCDNIKAEDIQIYTIGFGNSIPPATLDLLKECSTDGSNYYDAKDGAALTKAFSDITNKLSNLYLSK